MEKKLCKKCPFHKRGWCWYEDKKSAKVYSCPLSKHEKLLDK